jgi:hypothetical protein
VIVLSGRVGDADRVRSFARGAYDHLNKGVVLAGGGWPDVIEVVRRSCSGKFELSWITHT